MPDDPAERDRPGRSWRAVGSARNHGAASASAAAANGRQQAIRVAASRERRCGRAARPKYGARASLAEEKERRRGERESRRAKRQQRAAQRSAVSAEPRPERERGSAAAAAQAAR